MTRNVLLFWSLPAHVISPPLDDVINLCNISDVIHVAVVALLSKAGHTCHFAPVDVITESDDVHGHVIIARTLRFEHGVLSVDVGHAVCGKHTDFGNARPISARRTEHLLTHDAQRFLCVRATHVRHEPQRVDDVIALRVRAQVELERGSGSERDDGSASATESEVEAVDGAA